MARIRTIKPEFWTDERLAECSPTARLLLIASLNFADDYGNLERSARQLKAQAFPYDQLDCEPLIRELLKAGLMVEYKVGNRLYLHIKGFQKHQRIEKRSDPRFPKYEDSLSAPQTVGEDSGSTPVVVTVLREGKGGESKGREKIRTAIAKRDAPTVSRETPPEWFLNFKLVYPNRSGDPNWRGGLRAANARIAEGHTIAEFMAGAERYAKFCEATGKVGTEIVQQASRFLGPGKPFLLPWDLPAGKADIRLGQNLSAAEEFMRRTDGEAA